MSMTSHVSIEIQVVTLKAQGVMGLMVGMFVFWETHQCSINILYSLLPPPPPPYMCMLTCTHALTHMHMCTYTCAYRHACTHICTHAYICTHGDFSFLVGGEEIISPSSIQHSFESLLKGITTSCQTQP